MSALDSILKNVLEIVYLRPKLLCDDLSQASVLSTQLYRLCDTVADVERMFGNDFQVRDTYSRPISPDESLLKVLIANDNKLRIVRTNSNAPSLSSFHFEGDVRVPTTPIFGFPINDIEASPMYITLGDIRQKIAAALRDAGLPVVTRLKTTEDTEFDLKMPFVTMVQHMSHTIILDLELPQNVEIHINSSMKLVLKREALAMHGEEPRLQTDMRNQLVRFIEDTSPDLKFFIANSLRQSGSNQLSSELNPTNEILELAKQKLMSDFEAYKILSLARNEPVSGFEHENYILRHRDDMPPATVWGVLSQAFEYAQTHIVTGIGVLMGRAWFNYMMCAILMQFVSSFKDMHVDGFVRSAMWTAFALRFALEEMQNRGYINPTEYVQSLLPRVYDIYTDEADLTKIGDEMLWNGAPDYNRIVEEKCRVQPTISQKAAICVFSILPWILRDWKSAVVDRRLAALDHLKVKIEVHKDQRMRATLRMRNDTSEL